MVKTAMNLVESCQKAFNNSKMTVSEFYKKYGNVPVVFCMKDDLSNRNGGSGDSRMVVKSFDLNGYHYATDQTPIDLWQLFEDDGASNDLESVSDKKRTKKGPIRPIPQQSQQMGLDNSFNDLILKQSTSANYDPKSPAVSVSAKSSQVINPYAKTDNLVTVERRIDPTTGQNVYVRYMNQENQGIDPQLSKLFKGKR